jgi:hypothetical protein
VPPGSAARPRVARAFVALLFVSLASLGFLVTAPAASADTTMTAAPLIDDVWTPGRHATVIVTIKSDRFINGTLRVKTKDPDTDQTSDLGIISSAVHPTGAVIVEQPVEVPGGSEKQFVAVLPAEVTDLNDIMSTQLPSLQFRIELAQGDTVLAKDSVTIRPQQDIEAVGVLPQLASNTKVPDRADLFPDTQKAHFVTLTDSASPLDVGSNGIEQLSTIIGSAADIADIGRNEVRRTALMLWVNRGGHLVVDASTGPIEGLPDAWQPGPAGFAAAGAGDVRLSNGNAVAGKWNLAILPNRSAFVTAGSDPSELLSYIPGIPLQDGLGRDAGFRLPDLGALVIFLVVYVILVGPVTFTILARADKRGWAWVCLPVLAILFTGVFSISGAKLRNTTEASHATLIEVGPTGSTAFTSALVGSVTGGRTTVQFGRGWTADQADSGGRNAGKPPTLTNGPEGLEAQLRLEPGAFSTVRASGPTGYANAVEVQAQIEGSNVKGTVKNNLDVELQDVIVMLGYTAEAVGTVSAHGTHDFVIERPRQSLTFDGTKNAGLPELAEWPVIEPEALSAWGSDCSQSSSFNGQCINPLDSMANRFGGGDVVCDNNGCGPRPTSTIAPPAADPASPINAAVWIDHLRRDHGTMRRFGAVTVAGWTDQLDAPVHLSGGQAIRRGRTAIVARGPVTASELTASAVRREVIRTGSRNNQGFNGGIINDFGGPTQPGGTATSAAYRLLMPATVAGAPITSEQVLIRLPDNISAARVLTPDGWKDYVRQPFSSSKLEIPLPAGSIMSGVVIIQVDQQDNGPNNFNGNGSTPDWQVRVLRAGEREKLEKNLALWKEQQDAYNKANPQRNNGNGTTTTCDNNGCTTSSSGSGGPSNGPLANDNGTTSGTVPLGTIPPAPPTTAAAG